MWWYKTMWFQLSLNSQNFVIFRTIETIFIALKHTMPASINFKSILVLVKSIYSFKLIFKTVYYNYIFLLTWHSWVTTCLWTKIIFHACLYLTVLGSEITTCVLQLILEEQLSLNVSSLLGMLHISSIRSGQNLLGHVKECKSITRKYWTLNILTKALH